MILGQRTGWKTVGAAIAAFAAWLAIVALALPGGAAPLSDDAAPFETIAPYAFLMNSDTATVLYEKAPDAPFPPASLAKLMTAVVVFDALKSGEITPDTEYVLSEHAWRTGGGPSGGSAMFIDLGSTVKVSDLIQGLIVQSGNDAAIALAEGMAGSEEAFAERMNRRARELGLVNSTFRNPTGIDADGMLVTARDLAVIARYLIRTHGDLYKIFSQGEFTWNKITQRNRNPLLKLDLGADGLKTGYTRASGYGLVASTVQHGQRLIMVVGGLNSPADREKEAERLIRWGYEAFEQITLFGAGESAGEARVFGGESWTVPLVGNGPIDVVVPRGSRADLRGRVVYSGPIPAPVEKGREVAKLMVLKDDRVIQETSLFTGADVEKGGLHRRAVDAALELIFGRW